MEDATITTMPENKSLITMDDMFIQIGKLYIDKINSDKIISNLVVSFNKYKVDTKTLIDDGKKSVEKAHQLEESNRLYQKHHTEALDKIQELQNKLSLETKKVFSLQQEIKNLKKRLLKKK